MKAPDYIVAVFLIGVVLIGFLFWRSPESASTQLPTIIAFISSAALVLSKLEETHKIVNSQRTEMMRKIDSLQSALAKKHEDRAVTNAVEQTLANGG